MQDQPEKKKIKLIYKELQVYLTQIPLPASANEVLTDREQWEHLNKVIDRLSTATGNNYDEYKTVQKRDSDGWSISIMTSSVRAKLASLIILLHEEYFSDEPAPFSSSPSTPNTVINNQNSQNQSQHQQQEQKIELEQMVKNAQEIIQAEYGEEQAKKAGDLIKQIISNPKNWAIIAASITALVHIGHVAFVAALPILGKVLFGAAPVHSA